MYFTLVYNLHSLNIHIESWDFDMRPPSENLFLTTIKNSHSAFGQTQAEKYIFQRCYFILKL